MASEFVCKKMSLNYSFTASCRVVISQTLTSPVLREYMCENTMNQILLLVVLLDDNDLIELIQTKASTSRSRNSYFSFDVQMLLYYCFVLYLTVISFLF